MKGSILFLFQLFAPVLNQIKRADEKCVTVTVENTALQIKNLGGQLLFTNTKWEAVQKTNTFLLFLFPGPGIYTINIICFKYSLYFAKNIAKLKH